MDNAARIIQDIGLRPTPTRIAVLAVLLNAPHALTHPEIIEQLGSQEAFDRVTLYRVLDWLVSSNLAHKVASEDRAWRFQATAPNTLHRHAHFQCSGCGKVYCLADVKPDLPVQLPSHFTVESVELNIKGLCAHCQQAASGSIIAIAPAINPPGSKA